MRRVCLSNQEALWNEAEAFISVCYEELGKSNEEKAARLHEIKKKLSLTGCILIRRKN